MTKEIKIVIDFVGKTGIEEKDEALEIIATFYAYQDLSINGKKSWAHHDFKKYCSLLDNCDPLNAALQIRSICNACDAVENDLSLKVRDALHVEMETEAQAKEPPQWWDIPGGSRPGQIPAWTGD